MRRTNFENRLVDDNRSLRYVCSVCSQRGLVNNMDSFEICKSCGFLWGRNSSEKEIEMWRNSWKEYGSKFLFDMPYKERCDYYEKIQECYFRKKYYIPDKDEISQKKFEDILFSQHGFHHKKNNRLLCVEYDGKRNTYDYETNIVYVLGHESDYIAICEKDDKRYLFVSNSLFALEDNNTKLLRSFYIGLIPDVFGLLYSMENNCRLKSQIGTEYYLQIQDPLLGPE